MKKLPLFLSVLLLLGSSGAWSQSVNPITLYRVNAGGAIVTDDSLHWSADTKTSASAYLDPLSTNYTAGSANWQGVNTTGAPDAIFGTNRYAPPYGGNPMKWNFPATKESWYQVNLYFAESPYASGVKSPGQRVFDVSLENHITLNDFDIYAEAGLSAIKKSFIVQVRDNVLDIDFISAAGSPRSPQVNGIEIKTIPSPIVAPHSLTGKTYADSVALQWTDASDNETGFEIYRKRRDTEEYQLIGTVGANVSMYTDTEIRITPASVQYQVRAINDSGGSEFSYHFSTNYYHVIPRPPAPITISAASSTQINLAFTDNAPYALLYKIYRSMSVGGPYQQVGEFKANRNNRSIVFSDAGLPPTTTYYYYIVAHGNIHEGIPSDTFSATTTTVPAQDTVKYRVNAGGPEIPASPIPWSADTKAAPSVYLSPYSPNYTSGGTTWRGVNTTAAPDPIFGPNRYVPFINWDAMYWDFPVTPGMTYQVNLYFAESPHASGAHAPGQRLFEVYVEGEQVLDNFDIYATGGLDAIRKSFSVQADDNVLNIFFWPEEGSPRSPQINGIEIQASTVNAPFGLTGVAYADSIILHWQEASSNETAFEIFKGEYGYSGVSYSYYATVDANTTTFKDINGRTEGFDTWYKVRAVNGSSVSAFSNEFRRASEDVIPLPPDPIITNVLSSSEISLTFYDNVPYAISFSVYRSENREGPYIEIARPSGGDYESLSGDTLVTVDSLLLPATTYYYYVESGNVVGLSSNSDTLALTTLPEANIALRNREAIKVYPNPAERIVSVQIDNAQEQEVYIEIADKVGLPCYRSTKRLESGKAEVDIANLENGIYILHVTSSSGKESFRLVKR